MRTPRQQMIAGKHCAEELLERVDWQRTRQSCITRWSDVHGRSQMLRPHPAVRMAALFVVATSQIGCADRNWHRASFAPLFSRAETTDNSLAVKTVGYREPIQTLPELIESNTVSPAEPIATASPSLSSATELSADGQCPPVQGPHVQGMISQVATSPRDARHEPEQFQEITLASAIQMAFSSSPVIRSLGGRLLDNPASAATVYDVGITASDPFFGPQAALAQFDNVLAASLTSANNDRVFNNVVVGGNAQELVQDLATATASVQRRTMTGATFDIRGLNGHDANNRTGNLFPSYWDTSLEAGVRQPLLQGAGQQFNSIAGPNAQPGFNFSNGTVIAQMNTQIASADFEIAIQQFTRELHETYWALHRAYLSYEQKRQTRDVAYDTWQSVLAKANQGLEGGQVDKESQAKQKYHRYQRAVTTALGGGDGDIGLYEAERRLRHLMGLPISDVMLLRPSDTIPMAPVAYDWESLVAFSMADRVELRRQEIKVRQQQMKLVASKNFLLPQLDVIGRYRVRGFGDDLAGDGPRFASSYDDFFSLDHQEFEFGVEWGLTAGRRQARAAVRNATLQLSRERSVLVEQQRELTGKLSEAVSRANSLYLAMQSGQQELEAAEARMRATRVLYDVGKTDLFMLLDARESLLEVSDRHAADQVQYVLALLEVAYQSGRILRDTGIGLAGTESTDCFPDSSQNPWLKTPTLESEAIRSQDDGTPAFLNSGGSDLPAPIPDAPEPSRDIKL
jgi:outer membrane protein TolC